MLTWPDRDVGGRWRRAAAAAAVRRCRTRRRRRRRRSCCSGTPDAPDASPLRLQCAIPDDTHTHTKNQQKKNNNDKQIKRNVSSSRLAIDPPSFYSFLFCFFLFVFGLLAEAGMRRKWAGIAAAVPSVAGVFFFFVIVVLFSCKRGIFNSKGVSVLFFFYPFFFYWSLRFGFGENK